MALRKFIRRMSTTSTSRAHPGQAKSVAQKRARKLANRTELARQAKWCGVTLVQLRQANQREIDAIIGAQIRGTQTRQEYAEARAAEEDRIRRNIRFSWR